MPKRLDAKNTTLIVFAFEGPDPYSRAGGLGTRVTELTLALAQLGFATHLLFIGDPDGVGVETRISGRLTLHRWCQWISQYYSQGVYQGEDDKRRDLTASAPEFVLEHIIRPALDDGQLVVVMAEEWHTAEAMCVLHDLLVASGLRDRVVLLWNANNTPGFDQIDWNRLNGATTVTTVSRYMKHLMWDYGVNPLVIPNGIPRELLGGSGATLGRRLRQRLRAGTMLVKIARWDPDKRWIMTMESLARLKSRGHRPVLIARGGAEWHGAEVLAHARALNLTMQDVDAPTGERYSAIQALSEAPTADVLNVKFPLDSSDLRVLYHCADAVLANSGHEPFGLVGLEAMAAGGVAFTGNTGEDYVRHMHNAVVLDTDDPQEAVWYLGHLVDRPDQREQIRKGARETAAAFTWERVIEALLARVEFLAAQQGAIQPAGPLPWPAAFLEDDPSPTVPMAPTAA